VGYPRRVRTPSCQSPASRRRLSRSAWYVRMPTPFVFMTAARTGSECVSLAGDPLTGIAAFTREERQAQQREGGSCSRCVPGLLLIGIGSFFSGEVSGNS
jgi:hypothetical protein